MKKLPNPFKVFVTPEYLFRPQQIATRLCRMLGRSPGRRARVMMPWGAGLWVRPDEVIGSNIWYYGVFDLLVAEVIARLLDDCERAADVGANIGQMTSLMASRVGSAGVVQAWEPHPDLFRELSENLSAAPPTHANARIRQAALGSGAGALNLVMGADWEQNRGTARLIQADAKEGNGRAHVNVVVETLDEALGATDELHLLKVDVEGFERDVLEGAKEALRTKRIRDILYEDISSGATGVETFLKGYGYTIFGLSKGILGPELLSNPDAGDATDNYLATLEPHRALLRMRSRGWKVLRG